MIVYLLFEMLQRKSRHGFISVLAFRKSLLNLDKFELTYGMHAALYLKVYVWMIPYKGQSLFKLQLETQEVQNWLYAAYLLW